MATRVAYTDENGEVVVNETWQKYEEKREQRLQEASGRTHYLNYSVETGKFSTEVLHRSKRPLRVLVVNYRVGDDMYNSIRTAYPNAEITTIGECTHESGPSSSDGLTTHIQVSLTKLSEYSLYTTLGAPKVDIMVLNAPKVTTITFEDDSMSRKKREDSYAEAEMKLARMYSLFQMISPTYWIFNGFSPGKKSKSSRLAHSFLCQRLERQTFQDQVWTNFEFSPGSQREDLNAARGREKLLLSGRFRHDIAITSQEIDLATDYDKNHPVYLSGGLWANREFS